MDLEMDERWAHAHFAFAADAGACRALLDLVDGATRDAARAYEERARRKAPDGWAPSPDEPGLFVPAVRRAPPPTLAELAPACSRFYAPRGFAYQRAVASATRRVDPTELDAVRLALEAVRERAPAVTGVCAALAPGVAPSPDLWSSLRRSAIRLARLVELGAPDAIVDSEIARTEARGADLLDALRGRIDEVAARRHERVAADDYLLLEASVRVCAGADPAPVGLGGTLVELINCFDRGDIVAWREPFGIGEPRFAFGDDLLAIAAMEETAHAQLDELLQDYVEVARDEIDGEGGDPDDETIVQARGEAHVARARDAVTKLCRAAAELARTDGALITIVQEAQ